MSQSGCPSRWSVALRFGEVPRVPMLPVTPVGGGARKVIALLVMAVPMMTGCPSRTPGRPASTRALNHLICMLLAGGFRKAF